MASPAMIYSLISVQPRQYCLNFRTPWTFESEQALGRRPILLSPGEC